MTVSLVGTMPDSGSAEQADKEEPDLDFTLNVQVLEAAAPVAGLLRSTSDQCGSSCSGTACVSFVGEPA